MLSMILSCVDGQVGDRVAVPFILSCGNCRQCARSRPTICEAHHSGHVDVSRFQAWEMRHENPWDTEFTNSIFFWKLFFNFLQVQGQPGFTMPGGFAEFVAIPRADRNVSLMPPKASCQHQQWALQWASAQLHCRTSTMNSCKVSFLQAAALGCRMTTAYRAVDWPAFDLYEARFLEAYDGLHQIIDDNRRWF